MDDPKARAELETLARICHEANRAWCAFNGDNSQPAWADAPDWQRESARAGVLFHIQTPDATDDASHKAWMEHKLADGWRYGAVKDPEAKTHPCLVSWGLLDDVQRFKDVLFRTIVSAAMVDDHAPSAA